MANDTIYIDPDTGDFEFDDDGNVRMIEGGETSAQNVRMTLQTYKESFPLDLTHGTDYPQFLGEKGVPPSVVQEVISEAVYQETDVVDIESIEYEQDDQRGADIQFRGRLQDGNSFETGVTI